MLFQLDITFFISHHSFCLLFPFSYQLRHENEIATDLVRETGNIILAVGEMMFVTFGMKLTDSLFS